MTRILVLGALGPDLQPADVATARSRAETLHGSYDLVLANGSWLLGGAGKPRKIYQDMREQGVDLITIGGSALGREAIRKLLETDQPLLRPMNMSPEVEGKWEYELHTEQTPATGSTLKIITLSTNSNRCLIDEPFSRFRDWLNEQPPSVTVLVDFHGEDLAMKMAMSWMYAKEVRNVHILGSGLGVGTCDLRHRPNCCFVSDVGICGGQDLVSGMPPDDWWARYMRRPGSGVVMPDAAPRLDGIHLELNATGGVTQACRLKLEISG